MSTSTLTVRRRRESSLALIADYTQLSRPGIVALVLAAAAAAGYVARWGRIEPFTLVHALLGVLMVAASASALNQWLERRRDATMERTAGRPLPAGRLSNTQALAFASLAMLIGAAYLWIAVNWQTAVWGFCGWAVYVWVYTPLKSWTSLNTFVGALAGASPALLGWSASGAAADLRLAALLAIMFLWQFPHFMAIGWIYREQYARAGVRTFAVVDPSGAAAGVQAASAALTLIPVSLIPALFVPSPRSVIYIAAVLALGVGYAACAIGFCAKRSDSSARRLLRTSLVYLPALLALLMFSSAS